MLPSTRDRTSTRRSGWTWPTNSYACAIVAGATLTTPTGVGGGFGGGGGALLVQAATSATSVTRTAVCVFRCIVQRRDDLGQTSVRMGLEMSLAPQVGSPE